jgi:hypothetical protein
MLFVIVIAILTIIGWLLWQTERQYQSFVVMEKEAIPKFDSLNFDVEKELPFPPPGAELKSRILSGSDTPALYKSHGRWLSLSYTVTINENRISTYYRSSLSELGWLETKSKEIRGIDMYYRGTGCIEIWLPTDDHQVLQILIWHDFKRQPFSPPIPNALVLRRFEFEGSNFAICP